MSAYAASGGLPIGSDAASPDRTAAALSEDEVWALVSRVQAGDRDAFGRIYDRYVEEIYRFVAHRVAGRGVAEDITSETFVRALRRIDSIQHQGRDLGAWLVTIARNLVTDHYKSGRVRLEISTGEIGPVLDRSSRAGEEAVATPEDQVVDAMSRADTAALVLELLGRLGADQRDCLTMRFLRGMSVEETANAMGKSIGAIKALQYRAVRALARMLPASRA